jgi:excisionase family DNA binding protein
MRHIPKTVNSFGKCIGGQSGDFSRAAKFTCSGCYFGLLNLYVIHGRVLAAEIQMSTSPTSAIPEPGDVFAQLASCQKLLTARDVAKILAISEKTVYSYVSRNMIPYYKIEANVRFRALEVADWLRHRAGVLRS